MSDIKALLKQAKRRQTTEQVCLRGDLAGQYEQLQRELAKLPPNNKLGGDPERLRITAEMDGLREEMQAGTVPFVLQALPEPDFQKLVEGHPPRRDGDGVNELDAQNGYNRATFLPALIRASVIEPLLDEEDWELLFAEGLGYGQVGQLAAAADRVNGGRVDVPFSPAGSSVNPD